MSDSREVLEAKLQTWEHIDRIRMLLRLVAVELIKRGESHDRSKLEDPEATMFGEFTPRLKGMTYGSDEYKQCLAEMGPALRHHYENNRHHPEHFDRGIEGMNLVDVVEMFVDWMASSMRMKDGGDIEKSVEIGKTRFGLSDQLAEVFRNTARDFGAEARAPLPVTQRKVPR